MNKFTISILLLFLSVNIIAQNYTLSGTVKDAESGETLIGVGIKVLSAEQTGVVTNEYGFYSITLPQGVHTLFVESMGYTTDTIRVNITQNIQKEISLKSQSKVLNEVVVSSKKTNENITSAQTGLQKLDMKEINLLPVLFGEKDILKSIQLLPGIKSGGDGGGSVYVRGGAGDQNLLLLDEAPVYNSSHLLGFFSTFNSDALKDVSVYKGTEPAQYGGRLSSVMDVRMKEGNKQHYQAEGSIGLISSKLSVEGPIVKDKGSFFISGRRTYADMFLLASPKYKGTSLYFYDLNMKANYKITNKDVVYLSGYFGKDNLALKDLFGINWGNATGTLRWNHLFNSKLFSNTSFIVSNYNYNINVDFSGSDFTVKSNINDISIKQDLQYYLSNNNTIKFGFSSIYHNIMPGKVTGTSVTDKSLQNQYSWENALFISDEWKVYKWLNLNAGLRYSAFSVLGAGDFYTLDDNKNVIDTTHYNSRKIVKTYFNPEPRFNASFILNDASSVKIAYARNVQYLHLISNSSTGSPTDKWTSSDNNIKPETADQYSVGYFKNFNKDMFESSIEVYYKDMKNQIDYKDGADVLFNEQLATQLLYGIGRAYGLEFYLKKNVGRFTGWISYTLSRTEKKIDGINNGDWYAAKQDKTHDISIVASYKISKKVTMSANWVYSTGSAVTFPSGKYYVNDQWVWLYTSRNGYRMPAYHRLDIGINIKLKERRHYSSELALGLYNAYGRENAYVVDFREDPDDATKTQAVQTALFKFVPSISWNFKLK